jgi:copper homeostasis protein
MRKTIDLEVCINSDSAQGVYDSVGAAHAGGAARIELCAAMQHDGLTPTAEHMVAARKAFADRPGVMVMIRPRPGNFCYTEPELQTMCQQVETAAGAGVDGVVLGVLQGDDRCVAMDSLHRLVGVSKQNELTTTFHRAFDATPNPLESVACLIDTGVDRILTCGIAWGQPGTALDGIDPLNHIIKQAESQIEIVIGGGVNSGNVKTILGSLPTKNRAVSVHAYSGVQENGCTTVGAVRSLINTMQEVRIP